MDRDTQVRSDARLAGLRPSRSERSDKIMAASSLWLTPP